MNDKKRASLRSSVDLLNKASSLVDRVRDAEGDAVSNCPENLQGSERYQKMESAVESLDEAMEHISSAIDCIEAAI